MKSEEFIDYLQEIDIDFFAGVPDSQLKGFCNLLLQKYGISEKHVVCANEGAAVALGTGYYLATGKVPLVYMQNSGIGNAINPIASLINEKVYDIPMMFVVGWRGEPNVKDEPQHVFQGEITLELLECMGITYKIIDAATTVDEFKKAMREFRKLLDHNKQVAIVVKKGSFDEVKQPDLGIKNREISREEAIEMITRMAPPKSVFISTTGKASRELFEIREQYAEGHQSDFLTVGSMGHSSMIALGVAMRKKEHRVYCIDGDGALLMHMGSLGVIGARAPKNYVHILLNNEVHETVGGMPTVIRNMDIPTIVKGAGYKNVFMVETKKELYDCLEIAKTVEGPVFIEIMVNLFTRKDLGRPATTPIQNKQLFMKNIE